MGKVAGFSRHVGVATKARERDKLERLCRYITRLAVSEKRLSLAAQKPAFKVLETQRPLQSVEAEKTTRE